MHCWSCEGKSPLAGCRTTSRQSCLDRRTDNMCRSALLLLACGLAILALATGQGKPRLGKDGRPLLNKPKVARKEFVNKDDLTTD